MTYQRCLKRLLLTLFLIASRTSVFSYEQDLKTETSPNYQYELSIVAIFQNEAPYLKEWIEYHKLLGVQHFYLYNNVSEDDYLSVLAPYLENGEIELVNWDYDCKADPKLEWNWVQIQAYTDALNKIRGKTKWVAVIDLDEFFVPTQSTDLITFLSEYEDKFIAGVRVNWQMYGTSFISKLSPNRLMIEQLLFKGPQDMKENRLVKSIVRPDRVIQIAMHACTCLRPYITVNADKIPCYSNRQPVTIDKIRVNHYWLRDEDFCFNIKVPRLTNTTKWKSETALLNMFDCLNQEKDDIILRFVPELKKRMK